MSCIFGYVRRRVGTWKLYLILVAVETEPKGPGFKLVLSNHFQRLWMCHVELRQFYSQLFVCKLPVHSSHSTFILFILPRALLAARKHIFVNALCCSLEIQRISQTRPCTRHRHLSHRRHQALIPGNLSFSVAHRRPPKGSIPMA